MNVHLQTNRFILRDIEETDIEGMHALESDPEVLTYLGIPPTKTLEETAKIIAYIRKQYADNGIGRWAIIDKQSDDFVGWGGLKFEQKVRSDFDYYDLGYRLRKKYWGQGIGTEIATGSLAFGFNEMNLDLIQAAAHVDNIGSNKILKKIGLKFIEPFNFEGMPHNWYALHKSEYL